VHVWCILKAERNGRIFSLCRNASESEGQYALLLFNRQVARSKVSVLVVGSFSPLEKRSSVATSVCWPVIFILLDFTSPVATARTLTV